MSFAGRSEGLDFWVWCAALRTFFARDRAIAGFRDGDGEGGEDESLSVLEAFFSAVDGSRVIMSSLSSRDADAFIFAKDRSESSNSRGKSVGAMALLYRASWEFVVGFVQGRCALKKGWLLPYNIMTASYLMSG